MTRVPFVAYVRQPLELDTRLDLARRLLAAAGSLDRRHALTPYQLVIDVDSRELHLDVTGAHGPALHGIPETPEAYLAPEALATGEGEWTQAGRVYCAGTLLYLAFTGFHPLGLVADFTAGLAALHRVPESLRTMNPEIPTELDGLVLAMLAKCPEQRPASLALVEEALAEVATALATPTAPLDLRRFMAPAMPVRRSDRRMPGAAVLVTFLAVVAGYWATHQSELTGESTDPTGPRAVSVPTPAALTAPPAVRSPVEEALRTAELLDERAKEAFRPVAEDAQAALSAALMWNQAREAVEDADPANSRVTALRLKVEQTVSGLIAEAQRVGGERAVTYLEMVLKVSPEHPVAAAEVASLREAARRGEEERVAAARAQASRERRASQPGPPPPVAERVSLASAARSPSSKAHEDVALWLRLAEERGSEGKIILPVEDSAAYFLRRVLAADRTNETARRRLDAIEEPQLNGAKARFAKGDPDEVRRAQEMLEALDQHFPENRAIQAELARVRARTADLAKHGRLELDPRGRDGQRIEARFLVNGTDYGATDRSDGLGVFEFAPARYRIRVEAAFYEPWEDWVDLPAGETTRLLVELKQP